VELGVLHDGAVHGAFHVQVHDVRLGRVQQFAEQDSGHREVHGVFAAIQHARYLGIQAQGLGFRLTEIRSFKPYNLEAFHKELVLENEFAARQPLPKRAAKVATFPQNTNGIKQKT
jgi:hypothetical protein